MCHQVELDLPTCSDCMDQRSSDEAVAVREMLLTDDPEAYDPNEAFELYCAAWVRIYDRHRLRNHAGALGNFPDLLLDEEEFYPSGRPSVGCSRISSIVGKIARLTLEAQGVRPEPFYPRLTASKSKQLGLA